MERVVPAMSTQAGTILYWKKISFLTLPGQMGKFGERMIEIPCEADGGFDLHMRCMMSSCW
jgi:hypothetical protein